MNSRRTKQVAAAISAVLQYATEAEAVAAPPPVSPAPPVPCPSSWSLSGRNETMFLRNLWQRRLAKSW